MTLFSTLFLALCVLHIYAEQEILTKPWRNHGQSKDAIERDSFLIFNEVNALLRQWGNSLNPNGFAVALASVPANTLLYHARTDINSPLSPNWFALDSQMSYGIYGGRKNTSIYLRTYRTTASLGPILYLNGLSGILTSPTLDTQEILAPPPPSNCTPPGTLYADIPRARRLCKWASERGISGFIRNHIGFELLWCDMRDTRVQLVRNIELTMWTHELGDYSGRVGPDQDRECGVKPPPPDPSGKFNIFARYASWEWIRTTSHLYDGLGETRVTLQPGWFVTGRGIEAGLGHAIRLADLSSDSIEAWKAELDRMLGSAVRLGHKSSGIDWRAVTDMIVNSYGDRLPELSALLRLAHNNSATYSAAQVKHAYRLVSLLVIPFYDRGASPQEQLALCTFSILPDLTSLGGEDHLNEHEHKIWTTIVHVHRSICAVILDVHAGLAAAWQSQSNHTSSLGILATRVDDLIAQLDWSMWVRCPNVCPWGEVCYVPIWPFYAYEWPWGPRQARPEPRCVGPLSDL